MSFVKAFRSFPILFPSVEQIQQLTQSLNWNGQLTLERASKCICDDSPNRQAWQKNSAMDGDGCLARLAQGIGFKDFPLLQSRRL